MNDTITAPMVLTLTKEEMSTMFDLLESERARLPVEIRHTDHRTYRDDLRHRLDLIDHLIEQCRTAIDTPPPGR